MSASAPPPPTTAAVPPSMGTTGQGPLSEFQSKARQFHWIDYVVFSATLLLAALVGLYFGIKRRKKVTVKDMLMGGRRLRIIPVAISLVATFVSTMLVLGVPSETYYAGEWPMLLLFSFVPATVVTAHIFVPIFHRLQVTSAYEYLGLRFNNKIRFMGAVVFIALSLMSQALSVYTPALAFSLVAGISLEVSVLATGLVCTFYTALGGIRAVVAIDIIQVALLLTGVLGLLIKGAIDVGGITKIFEVAGEEGNRLQIWNYNLATSSTFGLWSQLIGGSFLFLSIFATNQTAVQRYCSIKKCKGSQKAVYTSMVMYMIAWILVLLLGLVIYTFYYLCDPLLRVILYSPDQIVPLFVMDTIGHLHGLPGLFTAGVFGAVLSTVSSGINSLAAVVLQDIIGPIHKAKTGNDITETTGLQIIRGLGLLFGLLTIGIAYLPLGFGAFLINIDVIFSIFGVLGGPTLGLFLTGALFPITNAVGAGVGFVVSLLFCTWMWIGRVLCSPSGSSMDPPEVPAICLENYNISSYTGENAPVLWPQATMFTDCPLQPLYDVSYLWYGAIGTGITLTIAVILSFCTCGDRGNIVDPALLCFGNRCYRNSMKKLHPAASKHAPKKQVWTKHRAAETSDSETEEGVYTISKLYSSRPNSDLSYRPSATTSTVQANVLWS